MWKVGGLVPNWANSLKQVVTEWWRIVFWIHQCLFDNCFKNNTFYHHYFNICLNWKLMPLGKVMSLMKHLTFSQIEVYIRSITYWNNNTFTLFQLHVWKSTTELGETLAVWALHSDQWLRLADPIPYKPNFPSLSVLLLSNERWLLSTSMQM